MVKSQVVEQLLIENLATVIGIKEIDAELQENPDYGGNFLQPLKFQGVRRMEEFNMVVGVKFMTKPGGQWTIRRDPRACCRASEARGTRWSRCCARP